MSKPSTNESSRYRLLCELGEGGMASVHLALLSGDANFRKLVALKRPKPGLSQDPEFLEMFMNEARLAARLNHPNVVQTYEVGRHDGEPFIAMEFLDGQPLHRLQRALPTGIPLGLHLRIISEVLSGLAHAHDLRDFGGAPLSVVHRDVSPQNVLVSYEGQAKVVDFGIAKAATHPSYTELGLVKGKLSYMSPEQALGESLDRRADLFSVGVMLWEAAAGARLWPGESARTRLRRLSLGEIPPFELPDRASQTELSRICQRAMAYSTAHRYQSAEELEVDLEALRALPGLQATRREVAAFMSTHFESQRQRVMQLIDAELGSAGVAEPEAAPGTRRVRVPVALHYESEPLDNSATSIAPAMATVSGRAAPIHAGRRWFAIGALGIAVSVTLALSLPRTAPVTMSTASSAPPASSLVARPAPTPTPSAVATNEPAQAAPSPQKPGKKSLPALPGHELTRTSARDKRVSRALDTSDPWKN